MIDFKTYDETKVSPEVKALAFCFDAAAQKLDEKRGLSDSTIVSLLRDTRKLYRGLSGAGKDSVVALPVRVKHDETCLKLVFFRAGAKAIDSRGWNDYGKDSLEVAEKIFKAALEVGMIRTPGEYGA